MELTFLLCLFDIKCNSMNKICFYLLAIAVLLNLGCLKENNQGKLIPIDIDKAASIPLKKYFPKTEIIALETSKESLINHVDKLIAYKDYFYVLDIKQKAVFIFESKGKYLNKIMKVGKGIGEYTSVRDFEINRFTNNLELLSPTGQIFIYSLDGIFKQSLRVPDLRSVRFFTSINSDTTAFYSIYGKERVSYFSRKKEKLFKREHPIPEFVARRTSFNSDQSPFILDNDKTMLYEVFSNNVYTIERDKLTPAYQWDFGDRNFNIEKELPNHHTKNYYKQKMDSYKQNVHHFIYHFENDKQIFTGFLYNEKILHLIYDKKNNDYSVFPKFDEGLIYMPVTSSTLGLYSVIEPKLVTTLKNNGMLKNFDKAVVDNIKPEDNPAILLYHF